MILSRKQIEEGIKTGVTASLEKLMPGVLDNVIGRCISAMRPRFEGLLKDAVAAERERCAKIVEADAKKFTDPDIKGFVRLIAVQIRKG